MIVSGIHGTFRLFDCGCTFGPKVSPSHNGWSTCEEHFILKGQRVEKPALLQKPVGSRYSLVKEHA